MKTIRINARFLMALCFGIFMSHSYSHAETEKSDLPESGPKISLESEDNFEDLSRSCDLENMQIEDLSIKSSHTARFKGERPCQKLLEADKKFQVQMKQAKCEAQEKYVPTEKDIRRCQIDLRRSASNGSQKTFNYQQDIKNRDECIVKLQSRYCEQSSSLSSVGE